MRSHEVSQIAVVTSSEKKALGYGQIFRPIPVVQVRPRFNEEAIVQDVHHDLSRAPTISLLKATEDLRVVESTVGKVTSAFLWWMNHEVTGDQVQSHDGTTWAVFNDIHTFLPNVGDDGITLEKPRTAGEWFAYVMLSDNQPLWKVSGHTLMKLGGDFQTETVGTIIKAQTVHINKKDAAALCNGMAEQKLPLDVPAGGISLSRDTKLFDTDVPLEVWVSDSIYDMNSYTQIASFPNWDQLDKSELWRITHGILPPVIARLTARLASRRDM